MKVSLMTSIPHMPRVTLRTVDPAKVLACQSVEKRCTRANAACATSAIILSVNWISCMKAIWRITTAPSPSPTSIAKADSATSSAPASPLLTASTS